MLIQGIQAKAIAMHACRDCSGSHPYSTLHTVIPTCPFCNRMKLEMSRSRAELAQRIDDRRAALQRPAAGQRRVVGVMPHRLDGIDRYYSDRKAFSPYR
jgi:hypothetical protein